MAVSVNASAVRNRVLRLRTELFRVADEATRVIAQNTIEEVKAVTSRRYSRKGQEQVGFNIQAHLANLEGVTRIAPGRYGILDIERMGTQEDFEAIAGIKGLWHQGTHKGEKFRTAVYENAAMRALVSNRRQSIWGSKQPQWIILENGSSGGEFFGGGSGAMGEPIPASNAIRSVTRNERVILNEWKAVIRSLLRARGIL